MAESSVERLLRHLANAVLALLEFADRRPPRRTAHAHADTSSAVSEPGARSQRERDSGVHSAVGETLTVPQMAEILGVNKYTLYKQIKAGTFSPMPFKVGSQWRFSRYQLDMILRREEPPEA